MLIFFFFFPLAVLWFVLSLAETSRTPFDLFEGESELVSGFNTEYGNGTFAMLFIAEYTTILFMCSLFSLFFLGDVYFFAVIFLIYMFIMVRGISPRIRYDKLMFYAWTKFLVVSMGCFMIVFNFVGVFFYSSP